MSRFHAPSEVPAPSRAARLLAQSLLAAVCGAAACADRDDVAERRVDEIGPGGARSSTSGAGGSAGVAGGQAGAGPVSAGTAGSAGKIAAAGFPCLEPEPLGDGSTVRCADGSVSRVSPTTCAPPVVEADPCAAVGAAGQSGAGDRPPGCEQACDAAPHGVHRLTGGGPIMRRYTCDYLCATDADCPNGTACACPNVGGAGSCVPAECSGSSDCAEGETCRLSRFAGSCGQGSPGLFCVGPADACIDADDCPQKGTGSSPPQRCASPGLGSPLRCMDSGSGGCGRPISIDETPRVASLVRGTQWGSLGLPREKS